MPTMFRRKQSLINKGPVDMLHLVKWGAIISVISFLVGLVSGILS